MVVDKLVNFAIVSTNCWPLVVLSLFSVFFRFSRLTRRVEYGSGVVRPFVNDDRRVVFYSFPFLVSLVGVRGAITSSRGKVRVIDVSGDNRVVLYDCIVGRFVGCRKNFEIRTKVEFVAGRVLKVWDCNAYGYCALLRAAASFSQVFTLYLGRIRAIRTRLNTFCTIAVHVI